MDYFYRTLLLLAINALLFFILSQINAALAPLAIHLSLDVLYLLFPALYLPLSQGVIVGLLTAAVVEAPLPVPQGTYLLLYLMAYLLMSRMYLHLRQKTHAQVILIALGANLIIILGLSFIVTQGKLLEGAFGGRLIMDLFISQLVLALVTNGYVHKQRLLFLSLGIHPLSDKSF